MFNFDNSMLEDVAKCSARAIAKHVLGRVGKGDKLEADVGNAGHAALEVHFGGGTIQEVLQKFGEEYDKIIPPGQIPDKANLEKENCARVLQVYCENRRLDRFPFDILGMEKMVGVEVEEGLKFWMKRDMLVKEQQSGMVCPMDHKFRFGPITEWWTKKFRMSSQFTGYIWGTGQSENVGCDRIYANVIGMGKIPQGTRKCRVHKVSYNECWKFHVDMELLIFQRTQEQTEGWKRDMVSMAKRARALFAGYPSVEYLKYAPTEGVFNGSCVFCGMQKWCRMGFKENFMKELTKESWWKPWEGEGND